MKNLILRFIVGAMVMNSSVFADDNKNIDKQNEFQRITLQRSWHYASLLTKEGSAEIRKEHARIMVTMAFHYWMMRRHNLIEQMTIYESQIKNTFKSGELKVELLKDPLGRFTPDMPTYALPGFDITDEDYQKVIPGFNDFIVAE